MGEFEEKNSNLAEEERIALMEQLLDCGDSIPLWVYDEEGRLLKGGESRLVLDTIFRHTGCHAYMLEHFKRHTSPLILSSQLGLMWCAVRGGLQEKNGLSSRSYVIGPVLNSDISLDAIKEAARRFEVNLSWRKGFIDLIQNIPVVASTLFFQYGLMLHYCASGEKLQRSDIAFQENPGTDNTGINKNADSGSRKDRFRVYQNEQRILDNVRQGNLDFSAALEEGNKISNGIRVSAGDPLKQMLLTMASFTSLCTRAAIEGGLSPDTAYTLGDSYIESLLSCSSITEMRAINHTMYRDFIERVHKIRMRPEYSRQIASCVNYIEMNLSGDLSIRKLARRVGYTEYYLSHKFKEETGISIGGFIRKARIERARSLLANTDMSVSKIADELHFCSSSYFSMRFEEEVGMLPSRYRMEKKRM
ncbi:MAG: AraC family transcriptional regulator [Lachnospiraceae bacterium]|nr:AraC family transcriptional regulator [Lachnospiraceae bacterium]